MSGWLRRLIVTSLIACTGATSIVALRSGAQIETPQARSSVWDGVYTRAQAERGKSEYLQYCASCHQDDLSGFSTVPPLAGEAFMDSWMGRTVDDLYTYIRSSMPLYQSTPISRQSYIDIVAFVLQSNAIGAGADELKPDSAELKAITISKADRRLRVDPLTGPGSDGGQYEGHPNQR